MALKSQDNSNQTPIRDLQDNSLQTKRSMLFRARRKLTFDDRSEGGSPVRAATHEQGVIEERRWMIAGVMADLEATERSRCIESYNFDITLCRPLEGKFRWTKIEASTVNATKLESQVRDS